MDRAVLIGRTDSAAARPRVAVLIPTLNEAENIDALLARTLGALRGASLDGEVLVADGGSSDGTRDAVRAWSARGPVRLVECGGTGGLSGDILHAARATDAEFVVVMDADLSHPPEALPALIRPLLDGAADMTIGSRYVPGGATPGWPWRRRLGSRAATLLAWPLVSVRDPMSGFFGLGRERLLALGADATGFKIGMEVLARGGESLRVLETPITFVDRERGRSKMSLAEAVGCARQAARLAGGAPSVGNALRFGAVGLLGMVVDLTIFNLLLLAGADVILSHVTSFVAATLFNYALNARWAFAATARLGDEAGWKRYLRFLVVCVLALILRGAVLEALAWKHGWPFSVAILPAIGAATLVNFVGSAFFIFGGAACRTSPEIRWRVLGLAVFAYSLALRLVFAGIVDLMPEEAYYWTYAQHPDIGYLDHPPMVAWLIWLGTWALGDTEIGVRLPAIACWLGASWFVYALTASQFGKTAGCRALALMSVFPIYFFTGVLMLPDAPLLAAWAGCLFFAQRALFAQRRWAWIGFGACLGVGLLSKYTIALLGPAALAFVLLDRPSRRWLLRPEPLLGALLAAALFSPVIVWNAMHGWESFTFQGSRRWSGDPAFSLHLLGGSIFLLLTPLGAIAAAEAVMHRWLGSRAPEDSDPLLIRRRLFATVFTIAPLSVFVVHALQDNPKINWTGPVWLAVIPLIAHAMTARPGAAVSRVARFGQSLWKPTVVGMTLLLGSTLYSMVIGPPVMPPFRTMQLPIAWEEMMREVEQIELGVIAETGREPVIVGLHDYFITAEHAFYDPAGDGLAETAGRGLFGYQGLMWDSWRPPRDVVGKDVLVLAFSAAQLTSPKVERQFLSMGPPQRVPVHKRGREAGQFFFRVGYGYQLDPSRAGVGGAME